MALNSNPSGQDIWDEFGPNSKPALNGAVGYNLGSAKNQLTGSNSYNRINDFANTGQPTASIVSAQGVLEDEAILRGSINWGGFECTYWFEWGNGNYNNSTPQRTSTQDELVSETITGLTNNTTYQYRLVIYNGYNDDPADYEKSAQETFTTQTPIDTSRPYNVATSQTSYTAPLETETVWELDDNTRGLQIQYLVNGSVNATISLSAGTTSHTRSGYASGGDEVKVKVRYTSGSNINYSPESTITLFESQ